MGQGLSLTGHLVRAGEGEVGSCRRRVGVGRLDRRFVR